MSAAPTCRYAGRDFTEDEIALIRDLIAEDPKLTRAHLSRAFCRRVGWVKPDGGLRDMMARCALLAMHRDGLIVLPPPRRPRHAPRPVVFGPESEPPLPPPPATIEAVRPLSLVPVLDRTSHNALLWKQFIARYHYLGYKPMAGAQMRYTVVDRHGASLAMIGMAAAAWKTAPRDHAIGWSPETRARNLHLVVNQSRLLLLPWIVIPNLGSHILSMLRRQLPGDWTQRYNVEPVLMETFVETPRFAGTIYKAANWTCIGTTSGRGRYDTKHECALTKKTSGCSRYAETGSADSTNDRNHHLLNERLPSIERFAREKGLDLVRFSRGERKDDRTRERLRDWDGGEGVLFLGKAQERARVVRTERRHDPATGAGYPWLVPSTAMVNQYYVYVFDDDFGPLSVKFCSYFPFNAKLCLNGHEYLKRQPTKRGIGFEELDNGILHCDDPGAMQAIAREITASKIDALFRNWLARLPHPFSARDRAAGIRYDLSIPQAVFALTQVFDRPLHGSVFFEEVLRENRDLGRPDHVQLIFSRRINRRTPRGIEPASLPTASSRRCM